MNAVDIIARCANECPDRFRAALISQAEMHDDYAAVCRDVRAAQGARASRNACLTSYDAIGSLDMDVFRNATGALVVALNVACKLLGISAAERTASLEGY